MHFKAFGLILIFFVCCTFGFLKARSLKARLDRLTEIKKGLFALKERLRLHGGDKEQLLKQCFLFSDDSLSVLKTDELILWQEFITALGTTDTAASITSCEGYLALFEGKLSQAQSDFSKEQRLYKSLGVLGGIFICIFLI